MTDMKEWKIDPEYSAALAAFAAEGQLIFRAGPRAQKSASGKDEWWAIIWKWTASGSPAEEIAKDGPFETEAEAKAVIDGWGKRKASLYNLLK